MQSLGEQWCALTVLFQVTVFLMFRSHKKKEIQVQGIVGPHFIP